jgi:DNA invertase Pin-like site-specific DNA recombinase
MANRLIIFAALRRDTMRVAIYARTASREGNPSPSIIRQLERLRAHVAAQGWALPEENIFVDDGYSGNTLEPLRVRKKKATMVERWDSRKDDSCSKVPQR